MASFYTSDELIKSVKRRAMIPSQQSTFTDEDFLAFADEEMNIGLVPSVLQMHEDYFLRTDAIDLESGKIRYAIPYRAIGNKLREVALRDSSENIFEMTRTGVGDLPFTQANAANPSTIYTYYVANNEINLVPNNIAIPSQTSLMMSYYLRPNSLVLLEKVAPITNINRETGVLTLSNLPNEFALESLYDFVMLKSPHKIISFDLAITAIDFNALTITMSPDLIPDTLAVGDHLCLAQQTAIPNIPSDLHVVLAHRIATRCLEAIGDTEGLKNANMKLNEMEQKTTTLIDNRVEDAPQKVVNRRSILASGLNGRRRYRSF